MSMRWMHPRRAFGWAFAAFLGFIGLLVAVSLVAWAIGGFTGRFPFFGFGFGWIFFLLFFLFFWGFRWWGWGGWGWYGRPYWRYHDDAHEILRARYARGEITKDQFDQMMRDLEQHA
ncbi:MAG TPA: SHOCT domain-containing protein [Thermoplasmata archaeon]|nr:SHOCT domain-containing protein [Thermoplasmata archaeon]